MGATQDSGKTSSLQYDCRIHLTSSLKTFSKNHTPSVPLNFEEYAVQTCSIKIRRIGIQYALRVFIVKRPNSTPMQSRHCAKCSNLFFSSFLTPILWSFTNRVILLVMWCCYGQIWLLDVRILCTEPRFCHWGPSAPKKLTSSAT